MFENSIWFYNEFLKIFEEESLCREEAILFYQHNTEFTDFITGKINNIISSRGYFVQNEYYRIDAMGYTTGQNDSDKIDSFNSHLWDLEIAVEHENDSKDWLDEVIKLAHICCPLRVVIGYVPMKSRYHGDEERLEFAASALRKLKCAENLKSGEFMVILGNSHTKTTEDFFNYKAYVLSKDSLSFEKIENYL